MDDIPSKCRFELIPLTLEFIRRSKGTDELAKEIGEHRRQANFLIQNARILRFIEGPTSNPELTTLGKMYVHASEEKQIEMLMDAINSSKVINMLLGITGSLQNARSTSVKRLSVILRDNTVVSPMKLVPMKRTTADRRAASVKAWLVWLGRHTDQGTLESEVNQIDIKQDRSDFDMTSRTVQKKTIIQKMKLEPKIWYLEDLYNYTKSGKVKIPQYQRGMIWSPKQKHKLIESISECYPIGALLLYDQEGEYQVIDGLQRTYTITEFMNTPAKYTNIIEILELDTFDEIAQVCGLTPKKFQTKIKKILENKTVESLRVHGVTKDIADALLGSKKEALSRTTYDEIVEFFDNLVNRLCKFHETVMKYQIPVLLVSGPSEHLPEIFNRVNAEGVQLTKYQIYAAIWEKYKVQIEKAQNVPAQRWKREITGHIVDRYESWITEGLDLNFSLTSVINGELTLFEFLLGFGYCLRNEFPFSVMESKNRDPTMGFLSLFSYYSKNIKTVMGGNFIEAILDKNKIKYSSTNLASKWKKNDVILSKDLASSANLIYSAYGDVEDSLAFLEKVNISKSKFSHPQYLIATIANWLALRSGKQKSGKKRLASYILQRYSHDIFRDRWRGTGDKQLFEAISDNDFLGPIPKKDWSSIWSQVKEEEDSNVHVIRTGLSRIQQLIMRIAYAKLQNILQAAGTVTLFEDDHIIPISQLKKLFPKGGKINHIGNRSLITDDLNRSKGNSFPHEFIKTPKGKKAKPDLMKFWGLDDPSLWKTIVVTSELIKNAIKSKKKSDIKLARKKYDNMLDERYKVLTGIAQGILK